MLDIENKILEMHNELWSRLEELGHESKIDYQELDKDARHIFVLPASTTPEELENFIGAIDALELYAFVVCDDSRVSIVAFKDQVS